MSFLERLQSIDTQTTEDPLVTSVRQWLDAEQDRFISVLLNDDDLELLDPPEMGGWQLRKPKNTISTMLTHPQEAMPGERSDQWGCNLGFRVLENGRLTGHFVWPVAFDREAVPAGLTPHEVRQRLLRLGHLAAAPGRTTTHLPRPLAKISAQGQPREVLETHSGGGLEYRTPRTVTRRNLRVRTLALRGFYRVSR